jgi:hypothetical protein
MRVMRMAERMDAATDGAIDFPTQQIDSIQARLAALEAQQNWLHLEQLRAEVAGLHQTVTWMIEYLAERDGAAVESVDVSHRHNCGARGWGRRCALFSSLNVESKLTVN